MTAPEDAARSDLAPGRGGRAELTPIMGSMAKEVLTIRVPKIVSDELAIWARKRGISKSMLASTLLTKWMWTHYIERKKQEKNNDRH